VEAVSRHKPYFSPAVAESMLKKNFVKNDLSSQGANVLTAREREVVQLIAEGKINKQVAYMLGMKVKTVETHRAVSARCSAGAPAVIR
jgi:DNA-binding NarL/FixJ family response regulator